METNQPDNVKSFEFILNKLLHSFPIPVNWESWVNQHHITPSMCEEALRYIFQEKRFFYQDFPIFQTITEMTSISPALSTHLLFALFAEGSLSEPHSSVPYPLICSQLILSRPELNTRNNLGESILSRLNQRINETVVGWGTPDLTQELLLCAQHLLDAGALPESIREYPPLDAVVQNKELLGLLLTKAESLVLLDSVFPFHQADPVMIGSQPNERQSEPNRL